ncbi:hypothetical protein pkur_cds_31 [Pandoravirus kuranda]|uniref:Uncharacterized protein n=1 Tax=Pandoravirus kuranda TaxID=3019033 RepID=A0AA95J763_9VIRU|nr:hypothetical protein pkur_cds_31 [Pandoravirus kuranda]
MAYMEALQTFTRADRQPHDKKPRLPTRGYKVLRADMTSLANASCAYAVGRTTTLASGSAADAATLRPGRTGLHFGLTPLDCAVDEYVRRALASSFPPPALAFVEVEATGTVVADGHGGGVTDALAVVRLIPTDEWRAMCSGMVKVREADGTVRIERYRHGRRHSPLDPTTRGRTLPAIEWPGGRRDWYRNGLLHRCRCSEARTTQDYAIDRGDGADSGRDSARYHCARGCTPLPAIVDADGTRHWYIHGMQVDAPLRQQESLRIERQRARAAGPSLGDSLALWSRWCTAPFASLST